MDVIIRMKGTDLANVVRRYVVRRVHFALGRFASRVGRIVVRMSDVNGTRGGADQCCHINVERLPSGKVISQHVDADLFAAIDRATERVAGAFRRDIQRRRDARTSHESVRIQA